MSETVGDFFAERLHRWGVRKIFGYPGDDINGVPGSIDRAKHKIEFIQVRHEEMAAFMASAYAKFSGELGVCLSTGGPGASHLITGLYDAKMDHVPVLAITPRALIPLLDQKTDLSGELIGMKGIFCDKPDHVAASWEEALACDRPVVLEFKTDPEVPPLPSHITLEEAKKFVSTILKGDPREGEMVAGAVRPVLSGIVPGDKQ